MRVAEVAPAVDPRDFRDALARFATGVTMVSVPGGDALLVNAFTSVSLAPPLVAFCVGRTSLTWPRMRRSPRLGVNVLPAAIDDIRRRAQPGADRLAGLAVLGAAGGVPRIADALAFLLCAPVAEHPAGDHTIVVCRVLDLDWTRRDDPLVFFGGGFGTFAAA